jgi:phosphohistidine phosphatase
MKTLSLIRHAKSSWDDTQQDDAARPLAKRGERDVHLLAPQLAGLAPGWGLVAVSPALRARQTAECLAAHGLFADCPTSLEPACYTFDADALAAWIRGQDDALAALTVIGHNPALHELVNTWYDPGIPRVPTLTVLRLVSDAERWQDFTAGRVGLLAYFYPAMFRN